MLSYEGTIPAMCWPRPLAYAACNEDPTLFRVPQYEAAVRAPVQNDTGALPHTNTETRRAVMDIGERKPEHVSEGGMFDCKSVFPGLGPPRESNYYEDDCLVDSCDILTRVSNQPPFNGQAARTIFAFGASELCRVISSLDSTGAVVIDIWDILAVRVLYFCSARVPGTLDRNRILEAFHQGETQVPSLHQL